MKKLTLLLFLAGLFCTPVAAGVKNIVLIAGPLDDHPLGTHEYENNVLVLKHALETASNIHDIHVDVHFGWPTNATALDQADTIVITSGGSDRKETDHPLYVGDHFAQLGKQMKRGCGVVMFHWSVFHPSRHHEQIIDWLGGYFDYETGTNGATHKWYSKIEHANWPVLPASPNHPLLRGIKPFQLKDEFYFNVRFKPDDRHFTPILFKERAGQENIIAWAAERSNGGRGFGFTCGHFFTNWWQPEFRKVVLNAIVWTAHHDVPAEGVESSLENLQLPRSRKEKPAAKASPEKKLKPASVPTESGAVAKEDAWVDNRWNQMDTGPFLASILKVPNGTIAKGLSIRIGENQECTVVYDTALCNLRAAWTGKLTFDPARFGLINPPAIAGTVQFVSPAGGGWNGKARYHGLFVNGKRVVLSYEVAGVSILDSPWVESSVFTRTLALGASAFPQALTVIEIADAKCETNYNSGTTIVSLEKDGKRTAAVVAGNANATLTAENGHIELHAPERTEQKTCKVFVWTGDAADVGRFTEFLKNGSGPEDLITLTKPGFGRWGEALATKGETAPASNEPYVVDTLRVPYQNPYNALMFTSGLDFFDNGDAAICTMHGDVWVVSGIDEKLQNLHWKRFATGLFQPLGLKVIRNTIYVLGRDQITALHDRNADGEADFYQNFYSGIKTSVGGHDYVTSLEMDTAGNFYYVDPIGLHRISRDGKAEETLATGFRNPNGIGISPTGIMTVAPQEGNWTPSSAICEIQPHGFYGYGGPQFSSARPLGYDAPLCWIPRNVDNSTASQVWVADNRFGPLENQMLSLSFGRCAMMLVLRDPIDGITQGGVVPLKPRFLSGAMRGAFRKQDGQLYVVGALGWQTSATREGCLQRVRYTGKKAYLPTALHVRADGIELTFSEPLERQAAEDPGSYGIEQWNYLYSKEYGSKEYSVSRPNEIGHDVVDIRSAKLSSDGHTIFLHIDDLKPVMQMQIQYNLNASDGKVMRGEIYNTIHRTKPL